MKKLLAFVLPAFIVLSPAVQAADNLHVGVVNFKTCVEESKMGKQEQATFEALRKQVEGIMEEKEKAMNEISAKLSDDDYMDGLSTEAENEIKHKFRAMGQELQQLQQQFVQSLQQANMKVLQKLNEAVAKAADQVAKSEQLDLVVNQDGTYYSRDNLNITKNVIEVMDSQFEQQTKEAAK